MHFWIQSEIKFYCFGWDGNFKCFFAQLVLVNKLDFFPFLVFLFCFSVFAALYICVSWISVSAGSLSERKQESKQSWSLTVQSMFCHGFLIIIEGVVVGGVCVPPLARRATWRRHEAHSAEVPTPYRLLAFLRLEGKENLICPTGEPCFLIQWTIYIYFFFREDGQCQ